MCLDCLDFRKYGERIRERQNRPDGTNCNLEKIFNVRKFFKIVKPRPQTPKPQTQKPKTKGLWADTDISSQVDSKRKDME